ncbi:hypothetical protein NXS19_007609 [Fusarium pseudograminearum]|nr:hypothetical protein NXS19_007609 [Fusarium pseudograminearum]
MSKPSMVPHLHEPSAEGSAPPGLESHLRNLIISNGTPAQGPLANTSSQQASVPQHGIDDRSAQAGAPEDELATFYFHRPSSSTTAAAAAPKQKLPKPNFSLFEAFSVLPSARTCRHPAKGAYNENRQGGPQPHRPWNGPQQHRPRGNDHYQPPNHGRQDSMLAQPNRGAGHLYNARRAVQFHPEEVAAQAALLDQLCFDVVTSSEIERSEIAEKEDFRCRIEAISREVIATHEKKERPEAEFHPFSIELKCFGSLSSGFATKASDMDLGLLSPMSATQPDAPGSPIPRLLEKALLEAGLGARLLTRTRVPIIKLCASPPEKLRQGLLEERFRWENGLDEVHEGHDDDENDQHTAPNDQENSQDQIRETPKEASTAPESISPDAGHEEPQVVELKQGSKNSLSSYLA